MVSREESALVFQVVAVLTFMRTCEMQDPDRLGKEYADDETLGSHIGTLKMLLPLDEVVSIAVDNGWIVIGEHEDGVPILQRWESSDEALTTAIGEVVRHVMLRLKTNLLADAAKRGLLDVSFDDVDGFLFFYTAKALRLRGEEPDGTDMAGEKRPITLESVKRFGYE